jgi:hypothetical protein
MNFFVSLWCAVLFFVLTPGLFLRLPNRGDKYIVACVHAALFALILHFTYKFVYTATQNMEGFKKHTKNTKYFNVNNCTEGTKWNSAMNQCLPSWWK